MDYETLIARLESLRSDEQAEGAEHFGIRPETQHFGIRVPELRALAKEIKRDHSLALKLWKSNIHEARLIATMIADPKKTTPELMDEWTTSFDTWDICDQACSNLYRKTPYAYDKIRQWSDSEEEFIKRAGFALMAYMAVHDKKQTDETFLSLLPLIEREADDERNFVKKAVNWALRQIGKRNLALNTAAIDLAEKLAEQESSAARWVANDALRELQSEKIQAKLAEKN